MTPSSSLTGLILAGGQSRRMGRNKALLPLQGRPLIEHAIARLQPQVTQVLISTNTPLALESETVQLADSVPNAGPLGGLQSGLQWLQRYPAQEWLLTVAVDTPFFPQDLASRLWQARQPNEMIVTACSGGRTHPVCSLWHISLEADLTRFLEVEQQRRVLGFIERHRHRQVEFLSGDRDPFHNLNTPQDWQLSQHQVSDQR